MTTLGEYRVGIDFNPSGDEAVDRIKKLSAALIDEIQELHPHGGDQLLPEWQEVERLKGLAMDSAENAAMYGVKAATKPKR